MRVHDLLHRKGEGILSVRPDAPLSDAMRLMAEEKVGTVLVVGADGALEGIVSERDLVRIFTGRGVEAVDTPVGALATRKVITCHDDSTLEDVTTLMSNNRIRHVPVMRDGRPVAMVSARDVMAAQKDVLLRQVDRHKQSFHLAVSAKKDAEQASRHKTEFMNHMSHELRTPLNAIIGFSAMIASQALGPVGAAKYIEYGGEINTAGEKLLSIINEILEMSQLEMGACRARMEPVDLNDEVQPCIDAFARWAAAKNIRLDSALADKPLRISGDRDLIGQMMRHLACNAIKFTPQGGHARIVVAETRDGGCCVTVADNGIGIHADALDSVTRPFWQVEGTMSRENDGAGLGLALTEAMIALHEGRLEIASAPGKGTTATLHFPPERRLRDATHKLAS